MASVEGDWGGDTNLPHHSLLPTPLWHHHGCNWLWCHQWTVPPTPEAERAQGKLCSLSLWPTELFKRNIFSEKFVLFILYGCPLLARRDPVDHSDTLTSWAFLVFLSFFTFCKLKGKKQTKKIHKMDFVNKILTFCFLTSLAICHHCLFTATFVLFVKTAKSHIIFLHSQ